MSAFGGKADIIRWGPKGPLIAINGPDDTGAVGFVSEEKRVDGRMPVIDFSEISTTSPPYVLHLFCVT